MIDEDLLVFLKTLLPAGPTDLGGVDLSATPIEKGKISQSQPATRIYYQRAEANRDIDLSGAGMLYETSFDVECAALNDDGTCQVLAQALKEGPRAATKGLNGYRGAIGSGGNFCHGAFVADHSDDYEPKLLNADEGYSVAAFRVLIIHEAA